MEDNLLDREKLQEYCTFQSKQCQIVLTCLATTHLTSTHIIDILTSRTDEGMKGRYWENQNSTFWLKATPTCWYLHEISFYRYLPQSSVINVDYLLGYLKLNSYIFCLFVRICLNNDTVEGSHAWCFVGHIMILFQYEISVIRDILIYRPFTLLSIDK